MSTVFIVILLSSATFSHHLHSLVFNVSRKVLHRMCPILDPKIENYCNVVQQCCTSEN